MTIDDDGDDGENNGDGDDIDDTSHAANVFCSCSTRAMLASYKNVISL